MPTPTDPVWVVTVKVNQDSLSRLGTRDAEGDGVSTQKKLRAGLGRCRVAADSG